MVYPKVQLFSTSACDFCVDPVQPMMLGRGGLALDAAVRTYAPFQILIPIIPISHLKKSQSIQSTGFDWQMPHLLYSWRTASAGSSCCVGFFVSRLWPLKGK